MVTGIGDTRDAALALVEKYQDRRLADLVFDLAWTHGQVLLRQLNATDADAQLYGRLAGSILYAHATLRPTRASSSGTAGDNPGSGDTPSPAICRLCCFKSKIRPILLHDQIMELIASGIEANLADRKDYGSTLCTIVDFWQN